MDKRRRIASFLLLPPVVFFEAVAWYGAMTVLMLYLTGDALEGGLQMGYDQAGMLYGVLRLLWIGGALLAGLIGIALGAHFALVLGLVTAMAGIVAMGIASDTTVIVPMILAGVGIGLYRPSVHAAAARSFGHPAEHLRNALFVLLWATMNLGAFVGPLLSGAVRTSFAYRHVFHLCGGILLLSALFAGGLGVAMLVFRRTDGDTPPRSRPFHAPVLLLAIGVLVVVLIPWTGYGALISMQMMSVAELDPSLDMEVLFNLNPAVVVLTSVLLVPALLILHFTRVQLPTLMIVGLGLLLVGVGAVPLLLAPMFGPTPLLLVSIVVMAVGETLCGPLLISRLAGDQHWRLATLVVGVWIAATSGMGALLNTLTVRPGFSAASQAVGWTTAGTALLAGVVLMAAAYPLRKVIAPPEAAGDEPQPDTLDQWQDEHFGRSL